MTIGKSFVAAGLTLGLLVSRASAAERDTHVWEAAKAARLAEMALLRQMVDIDSGTGDAAGAKAIDNLLTSPAAGPGRPGPDPAGRGGQAG